MSSKSIPLRIRLANNYSISEIEEMIRAIEIHPDSKVGARSPQIYNKQTVKKLDEMSWAIYSLSKKNKPEYIRKSSAPELKNW